MLCATDFLLNSPKEIAIVGHRDAEDTNALVRAVREHFVPNKVIALLDPSGPDAATLESRIPLLASKTLHEGKATAYVCKDFACKAPVTSVEDFVAALDLAHKGQP